jgi:SAM-dependent methyltransferase
MQPQINTRRVHLNIPNRPLRAWIVTCVLLAGAATASAADQGSEAFYEPIIGQEGKDVVWVPTPQALVEKMLDMAGVTPRDFVMDLGSGDGRNVIAAAKRGARATGVEYNPDMVELSKRIAAKEGVAEKASFVQGDMYEADVSKATVLALFLLTENLNKLVPKFLDMKPGSRIVVNGFEIDGWTADETGRAGGDCGNWCTAYLYIVPARVNGAWRLGGRTLRLEQRFQQLSGTLTTGGSVAPITFGRLRGDEIRFTVGGVSYVGRVQGDTMRGEARGGAVAAWTAVRKPEKVAKSGDQ